MRVARQGAGMSPAGGTTRNGKDVKWLQGKRRINVTLDNDMFDEIRVRAVKEKTTFAEQVRLLCEWGLEA